jgi:hypothetical protein
VSIEAFLVLYHGLVRDQLKHGTGWIIALVRRRHGQRPGHVAEQVVDIEMPDLGHLRNAFERVVVHLDLLARRVVRSRGGGGDQQQRQTQHPGKRWRQQQPHGVFQLV